MFALVFAAGLRRSAVRWCWLAGGIAVAGLLALPTPERHAPTCAAPLVSAPVDHLARCDRGARVRVSSVDVEKLHHPLFLIDGRIGGGIEKWLSFAKDRAPWIEIAWPSPRTVRAVVLHHAGVGEAPALNTRDFDVSLRAARGEWVRVARIENNSASVTRHETRAFDAVALRVDIRLPGQGSEPRARLYEVEVR